MTINEKLIRQEIQNYKTLYFEKFNVYPESWFSYLKWLANGFAAAHNFNTNECNIAEELFQ